MPYTDLTLRPARPTWPAMLNGMKCRCPNCGQGKLFSSYLKVHLAVGAVLHMEMSSTPLHPLTYLWVMIPLIILSSLLLLPVTKGAVVGLQWARYMHGFDPVGGHDEFEDDGRR